MPSTNFFGSVVISGGVGVASDNSIIHFHVYDSNSASPPVHAHSQGPPTPHAAPSSSTDSHNSCTPLSTTRSPQPFSLDRGSHAGHEAPNFPTDPQHSFIHPLPSLENSLNPLLPNIQRASTLPLPSLDSSAGSDNLPPDWLASYTEAPGAAYGFRMPIQRDSAAPFRPIGSPLQHQAIPRQYANEYVYYGQTWHGPMLPTPPVVWGEHHPAEGYGMPVPRAGLYEPTALLTMPCAVNNCLDMETTGEAEQNDYPG